jgi:hypothetical protein
MTMIRKATQFIAAIAVLAFAVPTGASAAQLTNGSGEALPVGSMITGRSNDFTVFTSIGTLECEEVVVHGEVTKNSGGSFEGVGKGAGETFNCSSEGEAITITDYTLLFFRGTGPSNGSMGVTFEADLPVVGTCHYQGTVPAAYIAGTDVIHYFGTITASPAACGIAEVEGLTTLERSGGGIILID